MSARAIPGAATFDAWSLSVGLVSDMTRDVETYRGWHADGRVANSGDAASRALFRCAADSIAARVGSAASVSAPVSVAGLCVARLLLSHANMVTNWPGMRDVRGVSSARLVRSACDEVVAILSALGLVERDVKGMSRVLRVDVVCGKVGAYLRMIDDYGVRAAGSKSSWVSASDVFLEAETMSCVRHLSSELGVDANEAARGLASHLVDATEVWDRWQARTCTVPRGVTFFAPGEVEVERGGASGWCGLFGYHPVDCMLPMASAFRAKARSTYDAVMTVRRNAGKTWAQYR